MQQPNTLNVFTIPGQRQPDTIGSVPPSPEVTEHQRYIDTLYSPEAAAPALEPEQPDAATQNTMAAASREALEAAALAQSPEVTRTHQDDVRDILHAAGAVAMVRSQYDLAA